MKSRTTATYEMSKSVSKKRSEHSEPASAELYSISSNVNERRLSSVSLPQAAAPRRRTAAACRLAHGHASVDSGCEAAERGQVIAAEDARAPRRKPLTGTGNGGAGGRRGRRGDCALL